MAKAVQSHLPSPSPKHETASSRNSIEKWYIIWGLDSLGIEDLSESQVRGNFQSYNDGVKLAQIQVK